MLLQTLEVALNGVTNIGRRFVTRFPLRHAAGQGWAFGNEHAVFIRFNRDTKLHAATLASKYAFRNATPTSNVTTERFFEEAGVKKDELGSRGSRKQMESGNHEIRKARIEEMGMTRWTEKPRGSRRTNAGASRIKTGTGFKSGSHGFKKETDPVRLGLPGFLVS